MSSMQWNTPSPQVAMSPPVMQHDTALWDKEFQSHEASVREVVGDSTNIILDSGPMQTQQVAPSMSLAEQDDLAKTAGLLIDTVKDDQNPKFKNSQFLSFMRRVRDGEVVVDGNDMVERAESTNVASDAKGKGKERATGIRIVDARPVQLADIVFLRVNAELISWHGGRSQHLKPIDHATSSSPQEVCSFRPG